MSVLKLRNHSPLAAPGVNPVDGTEPSFHVSLRFEPASRPFSRNQMTWTTPSDRSGQRELLTLRVVQMYLCDAGVPPPLPRVHLENLQDAHELLLVRTVPIGRLRHPYLSPLKRQRIIELDLVVAQLLQQVSLDSPELGESRGPQVHGEGCALHAIVGEMPLRSTEARDNADLRSSGIEREGDLVADSVLLIPLDQVRRTAGSRRIAKGEWLEVYMQIKWSLEDDGYVEMYVNGEPVIAFNGVDYKFYGPTVHNEVGNYLKIGLYRDVRSTEVNSAYVDNLTVDDC